MSASIGVTIVTVYMKFGVCRVSLHFIPIIPVDHSGASAQSDNMCGVVPWAGFTAT